MCKTLARSEHLWVHWFLHGAGEQGGEADQVFVRWHPLILSGTASTSAPHPDPTALTNPATEPHRELPRLPVCAQGDTGTDSSC